MKKKLCFVFFLLSSLLVDGYAYTISNNEDLFALHDCKQVLKSDIDLIVSDGENANTTKITDISKIKDIYYKKYSDTLTKYETSDGNTHEPKHIDEFINDILSELYCDTTTPAEETDSVVEQETPVKAEEQTHEVAEETVEENRPKAEEESAPAEEPAAEENGAELQAEPDVPAEETHEAQPAEANESDTVLTDDDFSADVPAAGIKESEEVSAPETAEEQSQQNPIQERALNYEMTISTSVSHTDGVTKATEQANTYAQTNSKAPDYECQQTLSDKPTYLCQSKTTQETIKITFTGWTDETPATVDEPQVAKNEEDEKADEQASDEEYQTKIIDSDKDTFIFKTAALDRASKAIDDSGAQFCQVKGNNVECTNETKKIKYVVQFAKIYETQEEYVNAEHPNKTEEDEKADTTADTKQLEADAKQIIDTYNKKKKKLENKKA